MFKWLFGGKKESLPLEETKKKVMLYNPLNGETKEVLQSEKYPEYLVLSTKDMEYYLDNGLLPYNEHTEATLELPIMRYLLFLKGAESKNKDRDNGVYCKYLSTVGAWIDSTIRELYPLLLVKEKTKQMKINYQEIQQFYERGVLDEMASKLNLSHEDIVSATLAYVDSLETNNLELERELNKICGALDDKNSIIDELEDALELLS